MNPNLQWEVEQFLYEEARLLDERRYDEWLALMTEDVTYEMPLRVDRLRRDERRYGVRDEIKLFDDDLEGLRARVRRLKSGVAWSEDPPTRVRHLVSNVQITPGDKINEIVVTVAFLVCVSRMSEPATLFYGQRRDLLRRQDGGGFRIARRTVLGDQSVSPSNNLTVFF